MEKSFAADPFDPRFVVGPTTDRHLTPLGLIVNLYWTCRETMKRECPDTLEFLEKQ